MCDTTLLILNISSFRLQHLHIFHRLLIVQILNADVEILQVKS